MKKAVIPFAAAALALLLSAAPGGAQSSDEQGWPRWRGPNGDGVSLETGWDLRALEGSPKVLWRQNLFLGYGNVAIRGNRLYALGWHGTSSLYCLATDSGTPIWDVTLRKGTPETSNSTPTIDGDSVYAVSGDGDVVCVDAESGAIRWKKSLKDDFQVVKPFYAFAASPLVVGDLVILTANSAGIALDKRTGIKVWGSPPPPQASSIKAYWKGQTTGTDYSTAVAYDFQGTRYVLLSSFEGMHSVEARTGKVSWVVPWGLYSGNHTTDPLVFGTDIFFAEDSSTVVDFSEGTPRVVWQNNNLLGECSNPVLVDGFIYGIDGGPSGSANGYTLLRCLDARDGTVMWQQKFGFSEQVSVSVAGGKLLVLQSKGTLRVVEPTPREYKEISQCSIPAGDIKKKTYFSPPVLYQGKLYCRNYMGDLVCLDLSPARQ